MREQQSQLGRAIQGNIEVRVFKEELWTPTEDGQPWIKVIDRDLIRVRHTDAYDSGSHHDIKVTRDDARHLMRALYSVLSQ
ncbi:MAG: hypothetical protein HOC05_17185 [Gemmatimonadetes bacterium]|jgi:hypothetical protein|nr:hypothetical protein [Gemmatimonadota bacterium]MBT4611779.1 hypothetical protein [Gemmatimonadota bacterium]MBT5141072.1 hypothetical protein [Gemmatimonadota bacterium]MBT5592059.1 hypothetical protein [Gemmatimonadota bacterium]MBT5964641.1 hypothetical protein [Gemmatimonadota bacterium]